MIDYAIDDMRNVSMPSQVPGVVTGVLVPFTRRFRMFQFRFIRVK